MNQRQGERRLFFNHIFAQMPLWETWETETVLGVGYVDRKSGDRIVKRNHCKSIPRRLRRSMARARAKREWGAAR